MTSAAKTVAKAVSSAAVTVAKHAVSAAVTVGGAVVSAGKAVASDAWAHRQGCCRRGWRLAVGLTVVNVLQLGLDPATDAVEAADVGALVADAGADGG